MAKTIYGFTYDEEDFNYFIGDDGVWDEINKKYNNNPPTKIVMEKGSYCGGSYIDYAPKKCKIGVDPEYGDDVYEVWWNLSEPITKEEYEEIFLSADLGDGDWYTIDKIIQEKNLPYADHRELSNKDKNLYHELWEEAYQRLLDEDYKRYVKLWHESKQAYYKYIDKVYQAGYKQFAKTNKE